MADITDLKSVAVRRVGSSPTVSTNLIKQNKIKNNMPNSNAMQILAPYKYHGQWVFDDETTGLVREAFVMGIDKMLDIITKDIPNAEKGFRLLFSHMPFPNYDVELTWQRGDYGGNWYFYEELGFEGWLCPALFKYFSAAPPKLYGKAEAIEPTKKKGKSKK